MKINQFEVVNFRNLETISLNFDPHINLFYGKNGSGKTSLIEAVHYLGLGRSFRTRNLQRITNHQSDGFSIFGSLTHPLGNSLSIGIERRRDTKQPTLRLAGKTINSLVEIAALLPIQLLNADSHLTLSSGPMIRRQLLDWGVFHVEPSFFHYWQRCQRLLKQRNAHLRSCDSYQDLITWDKEFTECACWLHERRLKYFEQLVPIFGQLVQKLLPDITLALNYQPGWNIQENLTNLLHNSYSRDKQYGYTHFGPQRADLQIKQGLITAVDTLSQGQQKLVVYSLRIAQSMLLLSQANKHSLFLIDDLPSELDKEKRGLVMQLFNKLQNQVIITGIERDGFFESAYSRPHKMFHVEHGQIKLCS